MTATVTFIGHDFTDKEGERRNLSLTVTVDDGDFLGILETVKAEGGSFLPDADGASGGWFLPWPPAAIRIESLA